MEVKQIDANELKRALDRIKGALAAHDMRPILTYFLLDEDRIRADNTVTQVLAPFDIGLKVAVPGMVLSNLVGTLEGHNLDLKLNDATGAEILEITATPKDASRPGSIVGKIKTMRHEDFPPPRFSSGDPATLAEDQGKALLEGMELCFLSAVRGKGGVYNGVALTEQGLFSTDNTRCSWFKGFAGSIGQVIEYESVQQFIRLGSVPVEMGHDEQVWEVGYKDGTTLLSKLTGIRFPVEKVVGQFDGFEGDGWELPKALVEALNRADFVQIETKEPHRLVHMTFDGQTIHLSSFGGAGDLNESMPAGDLDFVGEFSVVPAFLRAMLERKARMFHSPDRPILLFRSGNFEHIITIPRG